MMIIIIPPNVSHQGGISIEHLAILATSLTNLPSLYSCKPFKNPTLHCSLGAAQVQGLENNLQPAVQMLY